MKESYEKVMREAATLMNLAIAKTTEDIKNITPSELETMQCFMRLVECINELGQKMVENSIYQTKMLEKLLEKS